MTGPHVTRFDTEAAFHKAVDIVIVEARRRIDLFDGQLSMPRLDHRAKPLRDFLLADRGHRIRIVVDDVQPLESRLPRLQSVCRDFSHAVEIRRTPEESRQLADVSLLAANGFGVVRFHRDSSRGELIFGDAAALRARSARFDELWEMSESCSVGVPLGL